MPNRWVLFTKFSHSSIPLFLLSSVLVSSILRFSVGSGFQFSSILPTFALGSGFHLRNIFRSWETGSFYGEPCIQCDCENISIAWSIFLNIYLSIVLSIHLSIKCRHTILMFLQSHSITRYIWTKDGRHLWLVCEFSTCDSVWLAQPLPQLFTSTWPACSQGD